MLPVPFALIAGDWKYLQVAQTIRAADTRGEAGAKAKAKGKAGGPPMLVNLARDLGETQDLSTKEPAKFAEMKALLEKIRAGAP